MKEYEFESPALTGLGLPAFIPQSASSFTLTRRGEVCCLVMHLHTSLGIPIGPVPLPASQMCDM